MYQGAGGFTVRSLLSLQAALIEAGIDVVFDIETGGSIITKVRNRIVRRFIESGRDYLVFIDADMVFDAADVLALVQSDADVCGLNYRARKTEIVWMNRPVSSLDGVKVNGRAWVKTESAGTGLMAIHRRCLSRMAEAYPAIYEDNGPTLALFDFALVDGRYLGEDYLFCKRWTDISGEIWTLADATTGHMGETSYVGNYCDFMGGLK
jgi:hypothetical protein